MTGEQFVYEFIDHISSKMPLYELNFLQSELIESLQIYDLYLKENVVEPNKIVPDVYNKFIMSKRVEGLCKNSIEQYEFILDKFHQEIMKPVYMIDRNDIRTFLYNRSQNVSMRYVNHIRIVLNLFFTWCLKEEYINKNPMDNIQPIKYTKKQIESLTEKQIEICRSAYASMLLRDRLLFEFFLSTGCRAFEVCNVKKNDIDFDNKSINILGKGNKYRTVYLNERTILMLHKYFESRNDDNDHVFVQSKAPHDKLTVSGIETVFQNISNKVGIHIHPHMMRHTMATVALNRGMPLEEIQMLLGHSSPDTTMIYASLNVENIKHHHQQYLS